MARPPVPDAEQTQGIYERQAARYEADRSQELFERSWLDRFVTELPESGHVLDLGCGSGEPIARWLMADGRGLWGDGR